MNIFDVTKAEEKLPITVQRRQFEHKEGDISELRVIRAAKFDKKEEHRTICQPLFEKRSHRTKRVGLNNKEEGTHRADCASERRLPPPRPELHSITMSQGLPSVDTHRAKSSGSARARVGERVCPPDVLIDRQTHRRLHQHGGDGEIAAFCPLSVSLLSPL